MIRVHKKLNSTQVKAQAPKDKDFPKLKTLTHQEIYNLIAKFMRKAISVKGVKLSIINNSQNCTSIFKLP